MIVSIYLSVSVILRGMIFPLDPNCLVDLRIIDFILFEFFSWCEYGTNDFQTPDRMETASLLSNSFHEEISSLIYYLITQGCHSDKKKKAV